MIYLVLCEEKQGCQFQDLQLFVFVHKEYLSKQNLNSFKNKHVVFFAIFNLELKPLVIFWICQKDKI